MIRLSSKVNSNRAGETTDATRNGSQPTQEGERHVREGDDDDDDNDGDANVDDSYQAAKTTCLATSPPA